ncbi:MAG: hypothetical protein ACLRRK_04890 [Parasutterella sp.]
MPAWLDHHNFAFMRRAIAEPDQFHLHGFGVAVLQAVLRVFVEGHL